MLEDELKIMVTGVAGFIGFCLTKSLLEKGMVVCGYDNINDYYDISLKEARLEILKSYDNFIFYKNDLCNINALEKVFEKEGCNIVINLAARAGVRYSIENPRAYLESNIIGFFNVLECCKKYNIKHLIYASSSSVYGNNTKVPFATDDKTDNPISFYAASKKTDELMAYSYSSMYNIRTTGLRFFTVYGPFGRPDMAYFKFTKNIFEDKEIDIYNNGDMYRDFTYIDDIVEGIDKIIFNEKLTNDNNKIYNIYNIGNNTCIKLMDFINVLEECIGKKAKKKFHSMQIGDVYQTYANVDDLIKDYGYKPSTDIKKGLYKFVEWYKKYYNVLL